MESTAYSDSNKKIILIAFGSTIHVSLSALINFVLGIWLMLIVKLSIVVIIFIISIYAIFYIKYVNIYSLFRHDGIIGVGNEFNYVDIQILYLK